MANSEHLEILNQGVKAWNKWRFDHPEIKPDFAKHSLDSEWGEYVDFGKTRLIGANFSGADFTSADLRGVDFSAADLREANLTGANLVRANFYMTYLDRAILRWANLGGAKFVKATLNGADFSETRIWSTTFGDDDLSSVIGLESAYHEAPSTIGVDTIYQSGGKIPESFLIGCGLPQQFIDYIPSLIGAVEPFQYHSCFISHSKKDEEFAKRLYSRLRDAKVRVWFAPEDIKGGVKLYDQIEQAIQLHKRLLVVLSDNSLQSEWVMTEIRKAREAEKRENRRKLFPIRLADFEQIRRWRCPDADGGKDLAVEVREYFIPDFSNWKDHDSFEKAFERLLRDLREAEDAKEGPKAETPAPFA
jgi:uncharacterized protein YjbI with pentapeptide repeats